MNKAEILDRIDFERFYLAELPSLKINGGGQGLALCCFHEDKRPSLSIDLERGLYFCHACQAKGDIFSFYMKKYQVDFSAALEQLAQRAGITDGYSHNTKALTLQQIKEFRPDGTYAFQRMHTYKAGNPEYIKAIYKHTEGGKQARYFTLTDVNKGLYLPGRKSKPALYNQDLLTQRPDDIVCYAEGEKDCDTLTGFGFLAVTAGSATDFNSYMAHHKAEHFKGRDVVLFSDHDEAGYESIKRISDALSSITKSVRQVKLQETWNEAFKGDMPRGADITDFVELYRKLFKGDAKEAVLEMIENAEIIERKSFIDRLLRWNDVLTLDVRTEYLLDKLIPKNSITMLFGRGGIGKTSLCLQIARAIAEGIPFAELQTIKTPAYYIDFENPLAILKERVEKIGHTDDAYIWHISNTPQPPRLDTKEWELYKQLPPGLLIFDTLRASHLSDENNSQDMAVVISRLKELREAGFTILLLHHTPKSSENIYKGSTALLDLVDHCVSLEPVKDSEGEPVEFDRDNLYRFGVRIKTRYEPHHIYLRFSPDIRGFEVAKDPDIEVMEAIHELLADKDELNTNQVYELVRKELDIRNKVQVLKLLKKGEGRFWDTEKRGRAVYYRFKSLDLYIGETIKPINEKGLKISNTNTSQSLDNPIKFNGLNSIQTNKPIFIDTEVEL